MQARERRRNRVASVSIVVEHGPLGRYRGALTSRAEPNADPTIATLPRTTRDELSAIWLVRAAMERRVADAFSVIHSALASRQAPPELVELAARAIDDEYRHAELSRLVASRYAGREVSSPARLPLEVPRLAGARPELRETLHIVGQCILNETTAAAYLELCAHHAEGETARWAIRELLADEIDHARIGWAHIASLGVAARHELSDWLLPLAYLNLRVWRKETIDEGYSGGALAAHGAPAPADVEAALLAAQRGLICAGFEHVGVDASELEAWLASGADTTTPPVEHSRALRGRSPSPNERV